MDVRDTLGYLAGGWTLRRCLTDHRAATSGSFAGEADVLIRGRRGRYREHGQLRLGGHTSIARRALDLVGGDGGALAVLFTDGRPFFDLDLATGTCEALHLCGADRYALWFEARGDDLLVERWRVVGPQKDYEAHTRWERS